MYYNVDILQDILQDKESLYDNINISNVYIDYSWWILLPKLIGPTTDELVMLNLLEQSFYKLKLNIIKNIITFIIFVKY